MINFRKKNDFGFIFLVSGLIATVILSVNSFVIFNTLGAWIDFQHSVRVRVNATLLAETISESATIIDCLGQGLPMGTSVCDHGDLLELSSELYEIEVNEYYELRSENENPLLCDWNTRGDSVAYSVREVIVRAATSGTIRTNNNLVEVHDKSFRQVDENFGWMGFAPHPSLVNNNMIEVELLPIDGGNADVASPEIRRYNLDPFDCAIIVAPPGYLNIDGSVFPIPLFRDRGRNDPSNWGF